VFSGVSNNSTVTFATAASSGTADGDAPTITTASGGHINFTVTPYDNVYNYYNQYSNSWSLNSIYPTQASLPAGTYATSTYPYTVTNQGATSITEYLFGTGAPGEVPNAPVASTQTNYNPLASSRTFDLNLSLSEAVKPYGHILIEKISYTGTGNNRTVSGYTTTESFDLQTGLSDKGGTIGYGSGSRMIDSNVLTLRLGATFQGGTDYRITLDSVQDAFGNTSTGYDTITTTDDVYRPDLYTWNYNNSGLNASVGNIFAGQNGFQVETSIRFTSPETLVMTGHGTINLVKVAGGVETVVESFNGANYTLNNGVYTITSTDGSVFTLNNRSITIDPRFALEYGTTYRIVTTTGTTPVTTTVNGVSTTTQVTNHALTDQDGNEVMGLATGNALSFTTAAGLSLAGSTNLTTGSLKVGLTDNLQLQYSQDVAAGNIGSKIKLYNASGTLIETFTASGPDNLHTQFTGDHGGSVSFVGRMVSVDPGLSLVRATGYNLTFDSTAIRTSMARDSASSNGAYTFAPAATYAFSSEAAAHVRLLGQRDESEPGFAQLICRWWCSRFGGGVGG
jgi:hypothetical protein